MEKDENYSASMPGSTFTGQLDYSSLEYHQDQHQSGDNTHNMVDYMLSNNSQQHNHHNNNAPSSFCGSTSLDKLSFADVMQFADFGPKLALNRSEDNEPGIDPVYFLKFPVLNEKLQEDHQALPMPSHLDDDDDGGDDDESNVNKANEEAEREDKTGLSSGNNTPVQLGFLGESVEKNNNPCGVIIEGKTTKKKRPRTAKTSEEVESQRMTHIAVERNRRKQMNEHLRVLRSLMPGSYVQRGDQASIIGGAIEFVRELEQLLQCLESQKRRRLYGEGGGKPIGDSSSIAIQQPQPPFLPPVPEQMKLVDYETGIQEEVAESKSFLADVEVKLLGFDAMIKILSRRRAGQLIKIIAALEDMQLNILHTNITTIDQTVLYSFNVKICGEVRYSGEDIANAVQQIFSFIHAHGNNI